MDAYNFVMSILLFVSGFIIVFVSFAGLGGFERFERRRANYQEIQYELERGYIEYESPAAVARALVSPNKYWVAKCSDCGIEDTLVREAWPNMSLMDANERRKYRELHNPAGYCIWCQELMSLRVHLKRTGIRRFERV